MTDDLVKRLLDIASPLADEAAGTIHRLAAERDALTAERERLALAICGGEDAPGYANAQTVETLEHVAKQNWQSHSGTINSLLAAEAENDRLQAALLEERTETLWNAYNTGMERDGRWRHMCMSDGEWLERECGLDNSQPDHPADAVKAAIPFAAKRFVATLTGKEPAAPVRVQEAARMLLAALEDPQSASTTIAGFRDVDWQAVYAAMTKDHAESLEATNHHDWPGLLVVALSVIAAPPAPVAGARTLDCVCGMGFGPCKDPECKAPILKKKGDSHENR